MIFITIVQSHFYLRIFESKIMTLSWIFMAEHISLFGKMATLLNWIMSEPGAVSLVGITSTISTHKSCLKGGEGSKKKKKKEIDFFFQFLLRLQIQHHFGKLNFPVRSWEKRHFNEARSLFFWPFLQTKEEREKNKMKWTHFFSSSDFSFEFRPQFMGMTAGIRNTVPLLAEM